MNEKLSKKGKNNQYLSRQKYEEILTIMKKPHNQKSREEKRLEKRFKILEVNNEHHLLSKKDKYIVANEDFYNIITKIHAMDTLHAGYQKTYAEINKKYANISNDIVLLYTNMCLQCQKSRAKKKVPKLWFQNLSKAMTSTIDVKST